MNLATCPVLVFVAAALLAGCGSGSGGTDSNTTFGTNTPAGTMHLSGIVRSQTSSVAEPTPISGAEVKATIDRNHDGVLSTTETYTATTDSSGGYAIDVPVNPGDKLVLRFAYDGAAPLLRALQAAPKGDTTVDAVLRPLEPLVCKGSMCSLQQAGVILKGLPADTTGAARAFNPATESDAFPGSFVDANGKLLIPGAFASFDVRDGGGARVGRLPVPIEMRMRIPRETWAVVKDVVPGNSRIDVPVYFLDEVAGVWVQLPGAGHIEDAAGSLVAPSVLASIHDGTFDGALYAVADIDRIALWSVDWPVESSGCVTGRLLDDAGKPAEGALVGLQGVTYIGASIPAIVGADGRFCLEAVRSENVGEDLDGDGKAGESFVVSISATAGGRIYDLGIYDTSRAQAVCGGAGCLDLGDLRLSAANLRTTKLCTVTGTVSFPDGTPAAGALVSSFDTDVPRSEGDRTCTVDNQYVCSDFVATDQNGFFSVTSPVMGDVPVWATAGRDLEPGAVEGYEGMRPFASCPNAPVALTVFPSAISVDFTITVTSESGPVRSAAGASKWEVSGDLGVVMQTPATYGLVPPGMRQLYPEQGQPPPLASGDVLELEVDGATINGLLYYGFNIVDVP